MTYKEYMKNALASNPELRKEYDALGPEYSIINAEVAEHLTSVKNRLRKVLTSTKRRGILYRNG